MAAHSQRKAADRTPLLLRIYRHARVSLHVFQGIATTAFVFPMIGPPRRDAHRVNDHAREVLAAGDSIAIFPEGTTTDGTTLLPFHGSLLQPVIDAKGHLQPIAIRYLRRDGSYNDAPAYVGELTFMGSFWRVLGERAMVVDMTLTPALAANARHRRELSREAEQAIRVALGLSGPAPGTGGDRRA